MLYVFLMFVLRMWCLDLSMDFIFKLIREYKDDDIFYILFFNVVVNIWIKYVVWLNKCNLLFGN